MDVLIRETGVLENLTLLDANTGLDYLDDLVVDDPNMIRDFEAGIYLCDQETYNWWANVVDQHQTLNCRIKALVEEHGSERVYNSLYEVTYTYGADLELYPIYASRELDAEFGASDTM